MRKYFHIAIILSILFLPWWATAVLLAAACFAVDRFYEAVVYGIVFDSLYGSSLGFYGFQYAATAFSVLALALSLFLRKRLSW